MITVNIPPGAVQISQDIPALLAIVERLTQIETTLSALRAKVDTLVPDTEQLASIQRQIKAQNDALATVVATVTKATEG